MPLTKAQLREEWEETKHKTKELEAKVSELQGASKEREAVAVTEKKLKREPKAKSEHLERIERELAETVLELSSAQDRIAELEEATTDARAAEEQERQLTTSHHSGVETGELSSRTPSKASQPGEEATGGLGNTSKATEVAQTGSKKPRG